MGSVAVLGGVGGCGGSGGGGGSSTSSSFLTGTYLMAFHACDMTSGASNCAGNPSHHFTQLASSSDGASWTIISGWSQYQGSVPGIIRRGNTLYMYNASTTMRKVDATSGSVSTATVSIKDSSGANVQFADPSVILNSSSQIVIFFLNSTGIMGDPASCSSFPCTKKMDSATEVAGSDGTQFVQDSGDRAQVTLTGTAPSITASDPDVFSDPSGFVLLVSQGANVLAYRSSSLTESFSSIPGLTNDFLVNGNAGGVPAGYYDTVSKMYWIYVTSGGSTSPATIKRAVTTSLTTLDPSNFSDVVTGSGIGLGSMFTVESPSVRLNQGS